MANPFEKRATEYLADTEAFLALVTPEPLITFFQREAADGALYDRLAIVTGTPGSGKTTLARLFEFNTVHALLQHHDTNQYASLADALSKCGAIDGLVPKLLGARVPLESEYREFWEFPYPEDVRASLTSTLLQARTMIRWLRQLGDAGVDLRNVRIEPRPGAEAALDQIGGHRGDRALERARSVELSIYRIIRALVAPPLETLEETLTDAYHPFDVVQTIKFPIGEIEVEALPLAIFDDAHSLHPAQYQRMVRWLSQREMRIGRWLLTRLDALNPAHVFASETEAGMQRSRTRTEIRMQTGDRRRNRNAFRKMARDMSKRYMRQMDIFTRRTLTDLADLLTTASEPLVPSRMEELRKRVDSIQSRVGASDARRAELEDLVDDYFQTSTSNTRTEEVALAAVGIMLERYAKRIPQLALDLDLGDLEPNKPLSVDSGVIEGARVRLMHDAARPYYVGFDALCDASSENAEQFLQLASRLVGQAETHIVRGKAPSLSAVQQDRLIRQRATELVEAWDFPLHREVRRLTDTIGQECRARSLEGNASLGGGASAWGIPQGQFEKLPETHPEIARVLKFAVAYNAVSLKPEHSTKNKSWCLIELGGPVLVHHRLTLKRGGFLERDVSNIEDAIEKTRHA